MRITTNTVWLSAGQREQLQRFAIALNGLCGLSDHQLVVLYQTHCDDAYLNHTARALVSTLTIAGITQ